MATTRNKVMWQEGMLMRPHHFQQQQRYNDYLDTVAKSGQSAAASA